MTSSIWLRDIAAFALQITVVAAAGGVLARVLRIREPRAALAFWQALLVVCLLLPVCQPWTSAPAPAAGLPPALAAGNLEIQAGMPPARAVVPSSWPVESIVLWILACGIAGRAIWLTIGAFALRRLRRDAPALVPLPRAMSLAQERVGASAAICVSDRFGGPITFGVLDPVIIFPRNVSAMPPHVQEAIAYHELLHVKRRDWVHEVLEEILRAVLWFHPAIWWLIARIRLSREQVVDQAAIRLTESRDCYVEALLAVALARSPLRLALAPPFLRRSLLKKRVAQILQETTMTTRRLIASLTASAAAVALAATFAVRSFPLQAQARQAPAARAAAQPVEILKGGENLLHGSLPEYPRRAIEQRVEGDVLLDLAIDDRGEVSDARVLTGPDELRKAALESVLQWHYSPAVRSISTQAALRFHLPSETERVEFERKGYAYTRLRIAETDKEEMSPMQRTEHLMMELEEARAKATTPAEKAEIEEKIDETKSRIVRIRAERGERESSERKVEGPARLAGVRTERVPGGVASDLLARAGVKIGDEMTEATAKRIREVARSVDEHYDVAFGSDGHGGVIVAIIAR